ncbi:MAG: hypothetical protein LBJ08_07720, partial [Bifidobacteriaceae bacterium]|nr:hypothetical protein [Bifidobacteriaceae bacterium]
GPVGQGTPDGPVGQGTPDGPLGQGTPDGPVGQGTATSPDGSASQGTATGPDGSVGQRSTAPSVGDVLAHTFWLVNSGNVTVSAVRLSHAGGTELKLRGWADPDRVGQLAPGQRVRASVKRKLTLADIDSGGASHTARAKAEIGGGDPSDPSDDVTASVRSRVVLTRAPLIELIKTVERSKLSRFPNAGQPIGYTFTVANRGSVTLNRISIVDPRVRVPAELLSWPGPVGVLAPGESVSATVYAALAQRDIDAGRIAVAASVSAEGPGGDPGDGEDDVVGAAIVREELALKPALSLSKTQDVSGVSQPPKAGNEVVYGFAVTNTGNATIEAVAITDSQLAAPPAFTGWPGREGVLRPGQSVRAAGTYRLRERDVAAQHMTHSARVDGEAPGGDPLTVADNVEATVTGRVSLGATPRLMLTATLDPANAAPHTLGSEVRFVYEAANTGNQPLTHVRIRREGPGPLTIGEWPDPSSPSVLAPGETITGTMTRTLTQQDVDAGSVVGAASVHGQTLDGQTVVPSSVRVEELVAGTPAMTVTRTATSGDEGDAPKAGDSIHYAVEIANTGTVTLSGVALEDPVVHSGVRWPDPGAPGVLAPGQTAAATGTYRLRQQDVDAGTVGGVAMATAKGPGGNLADPSDDVRAHGQAETALPAKPALDVAAAAEAPTGPPAAGKTATIAAKIANTGNVTLTQVTVTRKVTGSGELPGDGRPWGAGEPATAGEGAPGRASPHEEPTQVDWPDPSSPGVIRPGETATAQIAHVLTQGDIDSGHSMALVEARGERPRGDLGRPDDDITAVGSIDMPLARGGEMTATVATDTSGLSAVPFAGEPVGYSLRLVNSGRTTLTEVAPAGSAPASVLNLGPWPGQPGVLEPGQAVGAQGVYRLRQGDVDAEVVRFTLAVRAESPGGRPTIPDDDVTATAAIATALAAHPALSLTKTVNAPDVALDAGGITQPGSRDRVTRSQIADAASDPGESSQPGSRDRVARSQIPGAASDPGESSQPDGRERLTRSQVTDAAADPSESSPPGRCPGGSTVCDPLGSPQPLGAEAPLTYSFTVANTGNQTIAGIVLTDPLLGSALNLGPWPDPAAPRTLLPGESVSGSSTHGVTRAERALGHVASTATVRGERPRGRPSTPSDDVVASATTDTAVAAVKGLTLEVTARLPSGGVPAAGDVIVHVLTLANHGNLTLKGIELIAPTLERAPVFAPWPGRVGELAPGQEVTATGPYRLTQADLDAGHMVVSAAARGRLPSDDDVATATEADTVLRQRPALKLDAAPDPAALSPAPLAGETVRYSFAAVNAGNVTITGVTVTDPALNDPPHVTRWPDPAAPGTLRPGETVQATGVRILTQADVDAGVLREPAQVHGIAPGGAQDVRVSAAPQGALSLARVAALELTQL